MTTGLHAKPSLQDAPTAVMYAYPWALHDVGVERSLDEMHSCGIDAVQLALSYHVGTYLTPRGRRRRVYSGDLGALHFDARAAVPEDWPFAPPISELVPEPSFVTSLLDTATRHGIQTIAWVVYLYNHTLARSHPELAVRNIYDDPSGSHLCPANPAVRRYARTLTRATLSLGRFDGLHAESLAYLPYDYGLLNHKSAVAPSARARLVLSLCFCLHCRQAARRCGIQIESLANLLRHWTDDHLNRLPDATPDEPPEDAWLDRAFGGELRSFVELRRRQVVTLQHEVLNLASTAGLRVGSNLIEDEELGVNGTSADAIRPLVDELRVKILPGMDASGIRKALAAAHLHVRPNVPAYAFFQLEHFRSEDDFARAVDLASAVGLRHYRFYEFSLLSRRQIDWLRNARHSWSGANGQVGDAR